MMNLKVILLVSCLLLATVNGLPAPRKNAPKKNRVGMLSQKRASPVAHQKIGGRVQRDLEYLFRTAGTE